MVTIRSLSAPSPPRGLTIASAFTLNNIRAPKFVDYRWLSVFLDPRPWGGIS